MLRKGQGHKRQRKTEKLHHRMEEAAPCGIQGWMPSQKRTLAREKKAKSE